MVGKKALGAKNRTFFDDTLDGTCRMDREFGTAMRFARPFVVCVGGPVATTTSIALEAATHIPGSVLGAPALFRLLQRFPSCPAAASAVCYCH